MTFDVVISNILTYVIVISALAFGVERIMDIIKRIFHKKLVREETPEEEEFEKKKERKEKDSKRQRHVRIWAIIFGMAFAFICQIDTFDLLGIPSIYWGGYPFLGYLLSGFAASRGSAFWHDILELVKAVKETKQGITETKKQARAGQPVGG